jgi:hypothetical protein
MNVVEVVLVAVWGQLRVFWFESKELALGALFEMIMGSQK